jgi:predicted hydrolase (HD superfamily)
MTRDDALTILHELVKSPSLLRHSFAVEQVMRCAATHYGGPDADPDKYALSGLLHDADWEAFPENHPLHIVQRLRELGEYEVAQSIAAHGSSFGVPVQNTMDSVLLACDELTGFVVACALLRPDGIRSLEPASILKKIKTPKFAAGVDRNEITIGTTLLGVELPDHVAFVVNALRQKADELDLSGKL